MSGEKLMSKGSKPRNGDVCIVNLPIKIVMVEDKGKFKMQVLSDQSFEYTEETELVTLYDGQILADGRE